MREPALVQPFERSGAWAVYVDDRPLGDDRAVGGSDLDAHAVAPLSAATVYTFSLILAVFLLGLGIGSSIGSAMARGMARPRLGARLVSDAALRRYRLGGVNVHAVAAVVADQSVVDFESLVQLPARSRPRVWAVLPAAILWGASFPLALALGGFRRSGSRAPCGRRLRREHGRRDRRRADVAA